MAANELEENPDDEAKPTNETFDVEKPVNNTFTVDHDHPINDALVLDVPEVVPNGNLLDLDDEPKTLVNSGHSNENLLEKTQPIVANGAADHDSMGIASVETPRQNVIDLDDSETF